MKHSKILCERVGIVEWLLGQLAAPLLIAGIVAMPTNDAGASPSVVFDRQPQTQIQIVGRSQVTVTEPMIRLSDIAEISSSRSEDDENVLELRKIEIMKSPQPGASAPIDAAFLLDRLKDQGVRLNDLRYTFPRTMSVQRAFREVSLNELEQAVRALLEKTEPNMELRRIDSRNPIKVAANAPKIEAISVDASKSGQIGVDFRSVDDMRFSLRALVDEWRLVPTARRPLMKGDSVKGADIELVRKNTSSLGKNYVENISDIVGANLNRDVGQGESFERGILSVPPVVAAGSQVTIVYRNGSLEATATGTAIDAGAINDEIRIRNDSSKKIVKARIQNEGLVAVGPSSGGN